jgi:hypothetical protein
MDTGEIQSAPVDMTDDGDFIVYGKEWSHRTAESMDLSGGDEFTIRETLQQYAHIFVDGLERMPHAVPLQNVVAKDSKAV